MRIELALCWLAAFAAAAAQGDEEYEYEQDYDPKDVASDEGQRLVGAAAQKHDEVNFVVAWNINAGKRNFYSACTGSLITPSWMVSAAHCDTIVKHFERLACIKETEEKGSYTVTHAQSGKKTNVVKCIPRRQNAIEIYPIQPVGRIWVGVDNMYRKIEEETFMSIIKKVILHSKSYRPGGSYGTFGGYDITLVNFQNPVPPNIGRPACLPTPSFKDQDIPVQLAGYGKYVRDACQTDEYGPYKYHYCKDFVQYGNGEEVCRTTEAPRSPTCEKFFKSQGISDNSWNEQEIIVMGRDGNPEYCYHKKSPNAQSRGWCPVDGDYYDIERSEVGPNPWGFCSKDCYLTSKGPVLESNVLRHTNAFSLDHKICEEYLRVSAENVKVHPEILCIGHYNRFNYTVFAESANGYKKVDPSTFHHFGQKLSRFHIDGYVTSAGTCNGDSGGPAYVEEEPGRFVVLGAVSGGRGKLGRCGGINNPVHYTRLSRFAIWIVRMLGHPDASQLCWHRSFQNMLTRSKSK